MDMREDYMAPAALPVMMSSEGMVCTSPSGIEGIRDDYGLPGAEIIL